MADDLFLPLIRLTETACRLTDRLTSSPAAREENARLRRTAEALCAHAYERLRQIFLAPIDREDLLRLDQKTLRLIRALEAIGQPVCFPPPERLQSALPALTEHLAACCTALHQAATALAEARRKRDLDKPLHAVRQHAQDAERRLNALSPADTCPLFYRLEAAFAACRELADTFAWVTIKND